MAQVLSVLESSRGARDGEQQLDDLKLGLEKTTGIISLLLNY
jgi:hypothetical protein